jgi:hypothetical protein
MPNYTYLIVGGGMTADAAVHGIREVDPSGSIGLLSADRHPPYDRPPLVRTNIFPSDDVGTGNTLQA